MSVNFTPGILFFIFTASTASASTTFSGNVQTHITMVTYDEHIMGSGENYVQGFRLKPMMNRTALSLILFLMVSVGDLHFP